MAMACPIARTLPTIWSAVSSPPTPAAARARRRWPIMSPSMRLEPTDSWLKSFHGRETLYIIMTREHELSASDHQTDDFAIDSSSLSL